MFPYARPCCLCLCLNIHLTILTQYNLFHVENEWKTAILPSTPGPILLHWIPSRKTRLKKANLKKDGIWVFPPKCIFGAGECYHSIWIWLWPSTWWYPLQGQKSFYHSKWYFCLIVQVESFLFLSRRLQPTTLGGLWCSAAPRGPSSCAATNHLSGQIASWSNELECSQSMLIYFNL